MTDTVSASMKIAGAKAAEAFGVILSFEQTAAIYAAMLAASPQGEGSSADADTHRAAEGVVVAGEMEGESVALMRPFWVSWWGVPGTFELHRPWWVSGERDDRMQSICAAVLAPDEFSARLSVQWAMDDKEAVIEWRFCEPAGARSVGIAPVVPVGSGEAGVYTQADYEEAAALGERDGYEKAVQDIDLLTGGDGEYKATTHDGVIDMPVMKARIIQRFSSLRQLVVPVGVSREEIARALFERHWSAVSASPKWPGDDDGSYWLWLADAILAALRPADTGWREITAETRNGDDVLAYDDETGDCHVSHWTGDYWYGPNGFKPTHWMPLPPAPTDTGANHD